MRAIVKLTAQSDIAYQNDYHHKLRGRIWNALDGTQFSDLHGQSDAFPFTFSNPFPRKNFEAGDEASVLISSPYPELIEKLTEMLEKNPEFNIGDMPFKVEHSNPFSVDVGEPMVNGTLQCSTGVYIKLDEDDCDRFDISRPNDEKRISWVPEHGLEAFHERVSENASWKYNKINSDYPIEDFNFEDLFDSVSFGNTYALDIPVTEDHTQTFLVNQARFDYTVRDDVHRNALNTLLDTGIGCRNPLGLGHLNVIDREHPVKGSLME